MPLSLFFNIRVFARDGKLHINRLKPEGIIIQCESLDLDETSWWKNASERKTARESSYKRCENRRTNDLWEDGRERPAVSWSESRWFPVKQTVRAATFRGMRPLAKGDVTRCPVSRDKKASRGASLAVRFIPRSVTAASLSRGPISRRSHGALVAVTKAYSGLTAASRSPRKLLGRHSTAAHLTSMRRVLTHTRASAYGASPPSTRETERSGSVQAFSSNVISRLDIPYVLSGIFDLIEKFWIDVMLMRNIWNLLALDELVDTLLLSKRMLRKELDLRENFFKA